jgi:hypothetical protein
VCFFIILYSGRGCLHEFAICARESQLGSSEVLLVVVNTMINSCVCGPREFFIVNRVMYILLSVVLDDGDDDDDDNNNNNNTSL